MYTRKLYPGRLSRTAKVQAELCKLPHESETGIIFAFLTTVYATVCLFVALRFATRLLTKHVRADTLAALFLATASYISAYKSRSSTPITVNTNV